MAGKTPRARARAGLRGRSPPRPRRVRRTPRQRAAPLNRPRAALKAATGPRRTPPRRVPYADTTAAAAGSRPPPTPPPPPAPGRYRAAGTPAPRPPPASRPPRPPSPPPPRYRARATPWAASGVGPPPPPACYFEDFGWTQLVLPLTRVPSALRLGPQPSPRPQLSPARVQDGQSGDCGPWATGSVLRPPSPETGVAPLRPLGVVHEAQLASLPVEAGTENETQKATGGHQEPPRRRTEGPRPEPRSVTEGDQT